MGNNALKSKNSFKNLAKSSEEQTIDIYYCPPTGGVADYKLLFIGTGEQGKSTFLKSIRYSNNPNLKEILVVECQHFYLELITITLTLLKFHKANGFLWKSPGTEKVADAFEELLNYYKVYDRSLVYEHYDKLCVLWSDESLLDLYYQKKDDFHFSDGSVFLVENVAKLHPAKYEVNARESLFFYRKTTGVFEYFYEWNNNTFLLVETGGQRNERKKWSKVVSTCDAIVYIMAVNDFGKKSSEDMETNCALESFQVFEEFVNSNEAKKLPWFVVFTKMDKLKQQNLENIKKEFKDFDQDIGLVRFLQKKLTSLISEDNSELRSRIRFYTCNCLEEESVRKVASVIFGYMIGTDIDK